jgi:peptide/nickel transport system permease protein
MKNPAEVSRSESMATAGQWQLAARRLRRHRPACISAFVLCCLYGCAFFSDFISPYAPGERTPYRYAPPHGIHFIDAQGKFHLRPFMYALDKSVDDESWRLLYRENTAHVYPISLWVRGHSYRLLGIVPCSRHLFGAASGPVRAPFLFGTDKLGRDLFSRILHAARISLTVGITGVLISFLLGCVLGGLSGYLGGTADVVIQRCIEFFSSLPYIPLWMALAAAVPSDWSAVKTYFAITVILSFTGWTGLARVLRGTLISVREEDYVMAARLSGLSGMSIILRHLLPAATGYLIVSLTLAIPGMILGETALSFLGIGIRPPAVSWGSLLSSAQQISVIAMYPWLMIPGVFVITTVLAFNFLGDGLRDAVDPYQ